MVSRVVVINDASFARGGATGLALLSARLLRKRGFDVTLISGDEGANEELRDVGVEIVSVGDLALTKLNPLSAATQGLYNKAARNTVMKWVLENDNKDTIYHVHGWSKILSPSVFKALRPVASRTVIHAHDFFLACPNGAFMDYPRQEQCARTPLGIKCLATNCDRRAYSHKLWRIARQVSLTASMGKDVGWARILLIHELMLPLMEKAGYSRNIFTTLRNPVRPYTTERVRAEDNDRIFFIGRLEEEKGIEDALLAARMANVQIDVIGDGPLRVSMQQQYPEARFHGWRSRAEIGQLISTARAIAIPSRYPEPYGLVAVEAASSGVPVIITNTALLAREIVGYEMGIACNTRDVENLANIFSSLCNFDKASIFKMSQSAFSSAKYLATSESDWVDTMIAIYEELLT